MGNLLLSIDSVLMCPHGGMVSPASITPTTYRISGRPPLLLGDVFVVSGCPFYIGHPSPCTTVQWLAGSSMLIIMGKPALTAGSTGICLSMASVPQGPVIIAAHQLGVREPDEFTSINE
jgi:hypothetical protein